MANVYRRLPAGVLMLATFAAIQPAQAQLLDDKANLKVLMVRAQMLRTNTGYFNDLIKSRNVPTREDELDQYIGRVGCGSVEIGNQYVSDGLGNEVSVVIVGDVLNVGNYCAR